MLSSRHHQDTFKTTSWHSLYTLQVLSRHTIDYLQTFTKFCQNFKLGGGWVDEWVSGFWYMIKPLCGSILQAGTCQILSLAESPRWSRVWQQMKQAELNLIYCSPCVTWPALTRPVSTWLDISWLNSTSPFLTWLVLTLLDLSWLQLSCPDLTWPVSGWLYLSQLNLTCPGLTSTKVTCPYLTFQNSTSSWLPFPYLTSLDLTSLNLAFRHHWDTLHIPSWYPQDTLQIPSRHPPYTLQTP